MIMSVSVTDLNIHNTMDAALANEFDKQYQRLIMLYRAIPSIMNTSMICK